MDTPRHTIIPPYLLSQLARADDPALAQRAERTLQQDRTFRAGRGVTAAATSATATAAVAVDQPLQREICTANNTEELPGTVVRAEGADATGDAAVDEAYDGFGATWSLFKEVYGRNSIDGAGMLLAGTVHYGQGYDNAFWNSERMVFGDGDGEIFGRFTASLEVIGHELAHGVTERTAALVYQGQSGALNEHVSDVFGILVKQRQLGQDAATADWLVGADLLLPGVQGVAIRSMINPGTAYDDPRLGKDPQPPHMDGYIETTDDNGGVHLNSGIPNRAFVLTAQAIGGEAWVKAGQIWYDVLTGSELTARADFSTFARLTVAAAGARYGEGSPEQQATRDGWAGVGVSLEVAPGPSEGAPPAPTSSEAELLLRRTGGVAGVVRERRTLLDDLPAKDARRWNTLLTSQELVALAADEPVADGFRYQVACQAYDLDVRVAERQLSESQRNLFRRTLRAD